MNDDYRSEGNIGAKGIHNRLVIGVPLLIAGAIASFLNPSFLGQVVAFFGFLGIFQARDRTCVALAARGARNLDGNQELLRDTESIEYFQGRARKVYLKTFFATLVLMLAGRAWLYFGP